MGLIEQFKRMLPPRRQPIPIFPLNTVLFPGGVLPLKIFEQRYIDMTKQCLKENSIFGVCLIKEGQETGKAAIPEYIGCTARIADWEMEQLGVLQLRTTGIERFRILESHIDDNNLITAEVETIPIEEDAILPAEFDACAHLLRKIVENANEENFIKPYRFDSATWVGYRLSEILPIKIAAKQKLMELSDPIARLQILTHFLKQQGLAT